VDELGLPYLLIATPALRDPNFVQTVVLMGHHDEQGALGWVINRLHPRPARDVLTSAHSDQVHADTPLHVGGPVPSDALLAIFQGQLPGVESAELAPGLSVSRSADVLPLLFSEPPGSDRVRGRLVFGYSGWGAGQLEREMQDGAWLALPADEDLAFSRFVDDLWARCFARLGIDPARLTSPGGRMH
jgi:putative transcriptional regulator